MSASPPTPSKFVRRLTNTALHQSAFAILGVTARDNRKRIVELAEEKSLELDHEICQKARSDLTNPRARLSAEMTWLPGVSPRKATQLAECLLNDPMAIREEDSLPILAHLNLLAAAFEAVDSEHDAEDLAVFILEIANLVEELDLEDIQRDINEDRAVSNFPEVLVLDQIEAELAERKRYYRNSIKDALDRLPSMTLIQVMTDTVDIATSGGDDHAPALVDDLVDSYEVETQGVLQQEAENVNKLVKAIKDSADSGEAAIKPYVDKLDAVVRNWSKIVRPIQLSAKARGIDHEPSHDLAGIVRNLAIDLFNKHDMLAQSQQLTNLLQELFSEVPDVSERIEQDVDALSDIFHKRKQAAEQRNEWARAITYQAEVGLAFKNTLSISPEGISWKGRNFPLDSITRVRWGAVRNYVNGIPTGTNYTIAFGDDRFESVVDLRRESTYSAFLDKLWRAVCVRLLGELLENLKNSKRDMYFGDILVHDDGVTLVKHKFLVADEKVRYTWSQVNVRSFNGMLYASAKNDEKAYSSASYIDDANTHILDQAIRMASKIPGMRRLSDILQARGP
jgi:Mg2+ and Co2+ transporter CorA